MVPSRLHNQGSRCWAVRLRSWWQVSQFLSPITSLPSNSFTASIPRIPATHRPKGLLRNPSAKRPSRATRCFREIVSAPHGRQPGTCIGRAGHEPRCRSHQWGISAAWSSVACQHSASFLVHDPPKPILAPVRLFQAREEISMRFDVSVAGNMHREMSKYGFWGIVDDKGR